MNDALKNLKLASQLIADAKIVISHHVEVARILMDEEQLAELKLLSLKIGSDDATIENDLNEFERISFRSKKFAVGK